MSLLIKALKQAERKHSEAKNSAEPDRTHEAADTVEATRNAAAAAPSSSNRGADQTLMAIDGADVELQIEVAKLQAEPAAAVAASEPKGLSLADADLPVWSMALATHESSPSSGDQEEPRSSIDSIAPATSAIGGLDGSPHGATRSNGSSVVSPTDPRDEPRTVPRAERQPISSPGPTQSSSVAAKNDDVTTHAPANRDGESVPTAISAEPATPSAGKRKTRAARKAIPATRVRRMQIYGAVALFSAACVAWVLAQMFGMNPMSMVSRPTPPAAAMSAPVGAPTSEVATTGPVEARAGNGPTKDSSPAADAGPGKDSSTPPSASRARNVKPAAVANNVTRSESGPRPEPNRKQKPRPAADSARAAETSNTTVSSIPSPADNGTPTGVKLSKSDSFTEQTVRLNEQAWQALARDDRNAARGLYQEVLKVDRNNADAWIGLGSIAARSGDVTSADLHYRKALEIDPNDASARAGLYALHANHEPQNQESRLRHLIERDGSQASLLFALGNALANQGRWPEAQQAYFAAYSADSANGDYAFNLAVSLERIRQPKAAGNFYRRAIELADRRPVQFDRTAAEKRLMAIEQPAAETDLATRP